MAVYGVGIREKGKYEASVDGKHTFIYTLWKNMLARCYSTTMQKHRPTYEGCKVEGDFLYFQKFAEWYYSQVLDESVEYQLDKDLIERGNKIYSADTCLLVPRKVNMFLCKSKASRGEYPIGVFYNKQYRKFVAQMGDSTTYRGDRSRTAYFDNVEDAFQHYRKNKKEIAIELVNLYKGKCDERVLTALLNYEVYIDD